MPALPVSSAPDVICIGHVSWDVSLFTDGYPEENAKAEVTGTCEAAGGPAATAACLLAAWGWRVCFAGAVGDDREGELAGAGLAAHGVDLRGMRRIPGGRTALSMIVVNQRNASRTIVNRKGEGVALTSADLPEFAAPGVILADGHEAFSSHAAVERWPEALSVLDAGSVRPGTLSLAPLVTHTVASARFARTLAGRGAMRAAEYADVMSGVAALCGRSAVITLGEDGCVYGDRGDVRAVPAFPVTAVDSTGAGDIFHGAFVHGLLCGWEMEKRLRFACAAGALSVTRRGGSLSIPCLTEVAALAGAD